MDKEARIFLVAVEKTYPARVALLAVDELAKEWKESKHGPRSLTCVEDGCRFAVRECVLGLARRFEDVGAKDQLTRVQAGVEGVREQMQVNITKALEGLQTTEEIMVRSEELKASALVFKKQAVTLKKMMWWYVLPAFLCLFAVLCLRIYVPLPPSLPPSLQATGQVPVYARGAHCGGGAGVGVVVGDQVPEEVRGGDSVCVWKGVRE